MDLPGPGPGPEKNANPGRIWGRGRDPGRALARCNRGEILVISIEEMNELVETYGSRNH